ncbi:MAG: MFS transporter [Levilactobacillus sp.]|jgi:predicted MFS family arabinose efflux permease|uniref:MFS transporter n=1 Tax=Levilactobacillus sp. TaxID=2767919 RepID=UPI0025889401|nr:MFS transporter [Levilactobacillus sp.]MCI1553218.1 MFS transporter [Levilactobacillus sp.]MCI1599449.1 MFS transporter [Levilactobacillus sp.]
MTKYRWQASALVLVTFMLGCNEFMVVGVISDIARSLRVTVATVGYLVTIFAIVYAISTPLITILANRFSRYKTLMVLLLIFLIGNTWSGFATSYGWFLVSRMMTAAVAGAIESLVILFANDIAPRHKRAMLISWIAAGFSIASVVGVPVGTAISTATSWHVAFHLISVLSLLTCIVMALLLPRHLPQTPGGIKDQLVLLTDKRVYLGAVLILFSAAALYAYYTYIRPLLTTGLGFSTTALNWLLFVLGIMSILGNRLSGTVAERNGLKTMPRFYVVDMLLLLLLPVAMKNPITGFGVFLVLMLIISVVNSPIQLHFLDVAEADYPQATLLASSLNAIFFNIGISIGSATASLVLTHGGLNRLGLGGAAFAGLSLVVAVWLNHVVARHRATSATVR